MAYLAGCYWRSPRNLVLLQMVSLPGRYYQQPISDFCLRAIQPPPTAGDDQWGYFFPVWTHFWWDNAPEASSRSLPPVIAKLLTALL